MSDRKQPIKMVLTIMSHKTKKHRCEHFIQWYELIIRYLSPFFKILFWLKHWTAVPTKSHISVVEKSVWIWYSFISYIFIMLHFAMHIAHFSMEIKGNHQKDWTFEMHTEGKAFCAIVLEIKMNFFSLSLARVKIYLVSEFTKYFFYPLVQLIKDLPFCTSV